MIPEERGVDLVVRVARMIGEGNQEAEPVGERFRAASGAVAMAADLLQCAADYSDVLAPVLAAELDAARGILLGLQEGLRRQVMEQAKQGQCAGQ